MLKLKLSRGNAPIAGIAFRGLILVVGIWMDGVADVRTLLSLVGLVLRKPRFMTWTKDKMTDNKTRYSLGEQ